MTSTININPVLTTNAAGTFGVQWDGLIQGTAFPDPAVRFFLAGGILAATETLPMWGGVGIAENIPLVGNTDPIPALGSSIVRATSLTGSTALTGFSVFDQAYGMVNSPQSPVQLAAQGMQVMYYRFGSGARIAVACDPALVDLRGDIVTSQVSWDFDEQRLIPYSAAYLANPITGATWANTSGGQATFTVTNAMTGSYAIAAGTDVTISGIDPGGYNGDWTVVSASGTSLVVSLPASAGPGSYVSGGTVEAGGGALNVRVLKVEAANCMTVSHDPTTGFATWNRDGSCAVILI